MEIIGDALGGGSNGLNIKKPEGSSFKDRVKRLFYYWEIFLHTKSGAFLIAIALTGVGGFGVNFLYNMYAEDREKLILTQGKNHDEILKIYQKIVDTAGNRRFHLQRIRWALDDADLEKAQMVWDNDYYKNVVVWNNISLVAKAILSHTHGEYFGNWLVSRRVPVFEELPDDGAVKAFVHNDEGRMHYGLQGLLSTIHVRSYALMKELKNNQDLQDDVRNRVQKPSVEKYKKEIKAIQFYHDLLSNEMEVFNEFLSLGVFSAGGTDFGAFINPERVREKLDELKAKDWDQPDGVEFMAPL